MISNGVDFFTEEMHNLFFYYTSIIDNQIIDQRNTFEEMHFKDLFKKGLPIIYNHNYSNLNKTEFCNELLKCIGKKTDVPIRHGNYADPQEYAFNRKIKNIPFEVFINNWFLKDFAGFDYLGNFEINNDQQNALRIKKPNAYSTNDVSTGALWIGKKGCITPLHCDGPDSFIYQLTGSKKWTLISPSSYPFLNAIRPQAEKYPLFYSCLIDFRYVDKEVLTKGKINFIEITLNPGDALYLPSGWFHFVETIEDSVMMNFIVNNPELTPAIYKNAI